MKNVTKDVSMQSELKDCSKVWQDFMPDVAWGTIWLFAGVVTGYVVVLTAALSGNLPYPVATVILGYLAFVSFTVLHEAGHGAIFRMGSPLKSLETVIGWMAILPYIILPYRFFQKIHDRHHAFTNDPDRDPDQFNFGDKWYQIVLAGLWMPFHYYRLSLTTYREIKSIRQTWPSTLIYLTIVTVGIVAIVQAGYSTELMYFGLVPATIAVFMLSIFFDYIPHHPHKSRSRYHDTRIYPSRFLNMLLLGQNYHLIHHMYPRLPWYTCQEVYARILPELEANNAPIEDVGGGPRPGFMASPATHQLIAGGARVNMLLPVKKVDRLCDDAVEVTFQLPLGERLKYRAGQYITVSKWLNGQQHTRCYSLCAAPGKNELKIGVRQTQGGLMSAYINQDLKKGDELIVEGPFGEFVYPSNIYPEAEALILVAGGSGITPNLAILETSLQHSETPVHLIYASRSRDSLMFSEQIEALKANYPTRLRVNYVLDQNEDDTLGICGQLSEALLQELVDFESVNEYYICGPEGLKDLVLDTLAKKRVQEKRIHVEQFVSSVTEPVGKQHSVSIQTQEGETHETNVASNQTILEVANATGISIPHACGNGTCGSCKCKVTSGSVALIGEEIPGITREEQDAGFTLACQARPQENLSIQTL